MGNISDLEINLDGVQEALQSIETLLNEIIKSDQMTIEEIKKKASLCLEAVNRYTGITNRNARLLNQQAYFLLKKIQKIQEETQEMNPEADKDSEFDIN